MSGVVRWPLVHNVIRKNSLHNTFGMVRTKPNGSPKAHQGWDFYAAEGTPCYAIADGKVVHVGPVGAFGTLVVHSFVFDGKTYFAAYAHLSATAVGVNKEVAQGQRIGATGRTGNASNLTGADLHLHFEIRTVAMPGLGLAGRISPFKIYGVCPLNSPIVDPVATQHAHTFPQLGMKFAC